jgi:hypothetical protein
MRSLIGSPVGGDAEIHLNSFYSAVCEHRFSLGAETPTGRLRAPEPRHAHDLALIVLTGQELTPRGWTPYRIEITRMPRMSGKVLHLRVTDIGPTHMATQGSAGCSARSAWSPSAWSRSAARRHARLTLRRSASRATGSNGPHGTKAAAGVFARLNAPLAQRTPGQTRPGAQQELTRKEQETDTCAQLPDTVRHDANRSPSADSYHHSDIRAEPAPRSYRLAGRPDPVFPAPWGSRSELEYLT